MDRWRAPGEAFDLAAIDPDSTDGAPGDKEATLPAFKELRHELADLQERLYAEGTQSLLVVIQAIDGGGKDGTIKNVFRGVNPQGVRVASFKQPSTEELAHDFLWRVHNRAPAKGEIGVFNRSHYEDVLVVRVHDLVPEPVWRARYPIIKDFEHGLAAAGTRIVKLFLQISKDEQADRFAARQADATKQWKYNEADEEERKYWDDYQVAFADAIRETSTPEAPWYIIPANRKWYRNWAAATIIVETLREMNPAFPSG